MPFGPKQAPAHFQRFITEHCKDFVDEGWLVNILDDFTVKSETIPEHITQLRRFLTRLTELNVYLKPSKCKFFQKEITFVGYVVNEYGYRKQREKMEAMANWGKPRNVKDVRSFLGYVNFYRPFVDHLSIIAKPLFELTVKGVCQDVHLANDRPILLLYCRQEYSN
ncbi:hypothetical protein SeLEV6574_g08071 [Synchytrium endobioticum]|uniref:Reverse transcriptase domain-containing protein n=1 Tax=Synchytrium endobioticum TaxID=286115 RepID=A0A507CB42_9FUNG|nr:hypothetical protein SeLEV6574_g08071 [Synchytrium endobioticum]